MSKADRCAFCTKIKNGRDRHGAVSEQGAGVVSFSPLNPVTEGHILFVPRVHVSRAHHNPGAAMSAFGAAATYAAQRHLTDYNLIQSNGPSATQTIHHVHVHLVPRRPDDGLALPWA